MPGAGFALDHRPPRLACERHPRSDPHATARAIEASPHRQAVNNRGYLASRARLNHPGFERHVARLDAHPVVASRLGKLAGAAFARLGCRNRLTLQHPAQQLHIFGEACIHIHDLRDPAAGMHDGGMVPVAELAANFRQRPLCQLLG